MLKYRFASIPVLILFSWQGPQDTESCSESAGPGFWLAEGTLRIGGSKRVEECSEFWNICNLQV